MERSVSDVGRGRSMAPRHHGLGIVGYLPSYSTGTVVSVLCTVLSSYSYTPIFFFQIHLIVGTGGMKYGLPDNMKGHFEDNAASTNDPIFFFHHPMIDCIFEEWLTRHPDAVFPVSSLIQDGHRRDDFSRGFFPVYTNGDMFFQAENFGYTCELENI